MSIVYLYSGDAVEIIYTPEVRRISVSESRGAVNLSVKTIHGDIHVNLCQRLDSEHLRHLDEIRVMMDSGVGPVRSSEIRSAESLRRETGRIVEFPEHLRRQIFEDFDHFRWPDELQISWFTVPIDDPRAADYRRGPSQVRPTHVWLREEKARGAR